MNRFRPLMMKGTSNHFINPLIHHPPKTGQGADQAVRNVYRDVADKYQDVLTLEASIAELHQMFLDFSLLVEV